ncbi:MAG: serine/threonine-protein kinase [Acidobacteriota bacterium]
MNPETIGRYEIKGVLGQGAMGLVYKAYDPRLQRFAAIKVMSMGDKLSEEHISRFFHEARSAAKLNHRNIISIYDLEEKDPPFIAMECLDGDDLKGFIEKDVFMSFDQKLGYVIEVCEALDYAHQNDVVHRDIKPGNMFITDEGSLKIVDFGLARLTTSEGTQSGAIVGSPYYMSPEQVKGLADIDGRSDLFSVGVVLYELVACRRPFEGDTPTSVCFQIVSDIHEPITDVLPGCSPELGKIVERALAKDRDQRYQVGAEMAADLRVVRNQIPTIHEALKRSIETLGKRLKYLADRGTIDLATAQIPAAPHERDDYGELLFVHAELKQRTRKALQTEPSASSTSLSVETQKLNAQAKTVSQVKSSVSATSGQDSSPAPVIPLSQRKWVWLGVGLAVVMAVTLALNWNMSLPFYSPGSLVLNVTPWAKVDSITSVDSGEAVLIDGDLTTPCVVPLPPGAYLVRVSNPYFGPLEFEVNVAEDEAARVNQKIPDFNVEEEILAIFEIP